MSNQNEIDKFILSRLVGIVLGSLMDFRALGGHSQKLADALNDAVIALLTLRTIWDQENRKENGDVGS